MSSPSIELPVLRVAPSRPTPLDTGERDRLIRRAKALSWLSLACMTAEGAIGIIAAVRAGSVALLGFGLDSGIEALASIIVIWRFTGSRRLSEQAEQRAQRLVAITFFLLAPYIAQDAIRTLINHEHPATSWLGIGLSISSIIVMPLLGTAKQRIGQRLGSGATAGEGTQNMLCAYLAAGSSPASRSTSPSACGGLTPPSRSRSRRSPSTRDVTPGPARTAAPPHRSPPPHTNPPAPQTTAAP